MRKKSYTKAMLVREIAFGAGLTQKKIRLVLDALAQITYREAADQGITIPGICRLDLIQRKERVVRNPQNGESILIPEHRALRVRPLKKARNAIAPPPKGVVTAPPPAQKPVILDDFSRAVSFRCEKCSQEIEAPHGAIGMSAQCPSCGASVVIPATSEPGTLHGEPVEKKTESESMEVGSGTTSSQYVPGPAADHPPVIAPEAALSPQSEMSYPDGKHDKAQTIRIDLAALGLGGGSSEAAPRPSRRKRMISFFCQSCRQEIEAPADMAGTASECPACGANFEVPFFSDQGTLHGSDLEPRRMDAAELKDIKARTIRIDIPDENF